MAVLQSKATGNFTAAGTWAVVDATSFLDSEASNAALTTSYTTTVTFTPGAIEIDGIAVKVATRATSPTGTITVALDQGGSTVSGTEVSINVADINDDITTGDPGWYFFKFATPVTLAAATAYSVKAKTSSSSQINLYRNATLNNWSRMLRTTTTQAPAASDTMVVIGEHTGAGTGNSFTVTMDNTATTDFGAGTDDVEALGIGKRGTLTCGVAASTNYYLKLSGHLCVYNGGLLNIGTVATPIPSSSSAVIEFDPVADGGMGLIARSGASVVMQGSPITTTKTKLTAAAAAAATTLTVVSTSGWAANGEIAIASTSRTPGESEKRTIQTVDSATQVTISAGLTNAHEGGTITNFPEVAAEVIYLTRNVKVRSASSTIMAYVKITTTVTLDLDYVEAYYLGENATGKRGIEVDSTAGAPSINECAIHDTEDFGLWNVAGSTGLYTNNVGWNLNTANAASTACMGSTAGIPTFTNNWLVGCSAPVIVQLGNTVGLVLTDNVVAGCTGIAFQFLQTNGVYTADGCVAHSCSSIGFQIGGAGQRPTFIDVICYRNGGNGFSHQSSGFTTVQGTMQGCRFFGNTTTNIAVASGGSGMLGGYWTFKNVSCEGDPSFSTANGITFGSAALTAHLYNCFLGQHVAHTTVDLSGISQEVICWDCLLASTVEVTAPSIYACFRSRNHDQTAGYHKSVCFAGVIESEATVRHTASGLAWRLDPSSATDKLQFPGPTSGHGFPVGVKSGQAFTISVWVRKDSSYNGAAPRLVLIGDILAGVAETIDTLTVGADTWEQLSVTETPSEDGVVQWYVDCSGTAGFAYVDDAEAA
jgi:hypothetical protein